MMDQVISLGYLVVVFIVLTLIFNDWSGPSGPA
jgi:hypothetical protein